MIFGSPPCSTLMSIGSRCVTLACSGLENAVDLRSEFSGCDSCDRPHVMNWATLASFTRRSKGFTSRVYEPLNLSVFLRSWLCFDIPVEATLTLLTTVTTDLSLSTLNDGKRAFPTGWKLVRLILGN